MKAPDIVFSDFDGTLTKKGLMSPSFFDLLNIIENLGSSLVVVTGRPVSWSHFLMTHFPLRASISEGGGVLTVREGKRLRDIVLVPASDLEILKKATEELFSNVPNFELSDDSSGRITDRAIDLNFLEESSVEDQIKQSLDKFKISYSKSNVHLNYWFGEISKINGINYYLKHYSKSLLENCIYFGDSLNDESAFAYFSHSVGVSNISSVLNKMRSKPKVILEGAENEEISGVVTYLNSLKREK